MPSGPPIGEREREILTAIVETFIATGDPVGSRTLARSNREGLSPATIRNVMADLADAGYLEQPHTSAGRVPSSEAYRYYVEQLTGKASLSQEDQSIIKDSLRGVSDVQEFMEARFINENFRGWTMEAMRTELARRLEQERSEYDRLMKSVEQLYRQGALAADETSQVVFVEGASNLVTGEQDRQRLQELLQTLEEKQKIVELLGAYLDAKQEAVRVVIGLDEALPSMRNFVLIGAPARVGDDVMGSLAVIGPTRIDYQHTMTAVSYIARLFDKILNESE